MSKQQKQIDVTTFLETMTDVVWRAEAGARAEEARLLALGRQVHDDHASGRINQEQADGYIQQRIDPALAQARYARLEARRKASADPRIAEMRERLDAGVHAARLALQQAEDDRAVFRHGLSKLGLEWEPQPAVRVRTQPARYEPTVQMADIAS